MTTDNEKLLIEISGTQLAGKSAMFHYLTDLLLRHGAIVDHLPEERDIAEISLIIRYGPTIKAILKTTQTDDDQL